MNGEEIIGSEWLKRVSHDKNRPTPQCAVGRVQLAGKGVVTAADRALAKKIVGEVDDMADDARQHGFVNKEEAKES